MAQGMFPARVREFLLAGSVIGAGTLALTVYRDFREWQRHRLSAVLSLVDAHAENSRAMETVFDFWAASPTQIHDIKDAQDLAFIWAQLKVKNCHHGKLQDVSANATAVSAQQPHHAHMPHRALPEECEVDNARRRLMTFYRKAMEMHRLGVIDNHALQHVPGKDRAQKFLDNVAPIDEANGHLYSGAAAPRSDVFAWVEQTYNIEQGPPRCERRYSAELLGTQPVSEALLRKIERDSARSERLRDAAQ